MRPPKTPVTALHAVDKASGGNIPVYTFEQLHDFAAEWVRYERDACATICQEVQARQEQLGNMMGFIIAEECSNKIQEREE
jgi:hypothetical protein